jgi:hypothetical protein
MKRVAICIVAVIACALAVALVQRSARSAETCSTPWWFTSGQWTWHSVVKDRNGREISRSGYDTKLTRVMGDRRLVLMAHVTSLDPACTKTTSTTLLVSCSRGDWRVWPPDGSVRPIGPMPEYAKQLIKDSCAIGTETALY